MNITSCSSIETCSDNMSALEVPLHNELGAAAAVPPPYWQAVTRDGQPSRRRSVCVESALYALLIVSVPLNPIFGLFAVYCYKLSKRRSTSPDDQRRKSARMLMTVSRCASIAGIIITVIIILAVTLTPAAARDTCPPMLRDEQTFPYRVKMSPERCRFGAYCSGVCFYDSRAASFPSAAASSGGQPPTQVCDRSADLADDGFCYYSSPSVCRHSRSFANDVCYLYRLPFASSARCIHGYYDDVTGDCMYDVRYGSMDGVSCQHGNADLDAGRMYCYGSSETTCRFTKLFRNEICYMHRVPVTSTAECIHGYYDASGNCYYQTRYASTDGRLCYDDNADLDVERKYCYASTPEGCRFTKLYRNDICYAYRLQVTSSANCSHGYYDSSGHCYYNTRYESTDGRSCHDDNADLDNAGEHCFGSSENVCRFTAFYMNDFCYHYRIRVALRADCVHGYYNRTGYCYYDTRYQSADGKSCHDDMADIDVQRGFCYGTTTAMCKYTKFFHNDICYQYRLPVTSDAECVRGYYYADGYCYYDTRYESTDGRSCHDGNADLDDKRRYCYSSSPAACRFTKFYHNDICYLYRLPVQSTTDCVHGYYARTGYCYYDTRYQSADGQSCHDDMADIDTQLGYCYGSSAAVCKYTKFFHNNICYQYRLPVTSDAGCIRGYYDASGYCYYDGRYESTDGRSCHDGNADLDDTSRYCYSSSSAACRFTKFYHNDVCYLYRLSVPSTVDCVHGYYDRIGYCYYDTRYQSRDGQSCHDDTADIDVELGFCYGSSATVCKHTTFFHNDICYQYRRPVTSDAECVHGYYDASRYCYYDSRYESTDGRSCHDGNADLDDKRRYCFYSSPAACRFTKFYHNGICYLYRLSVPSTADCLHGYYHSPGYCYYDSRYESTDSTSCQNGNGDLDVSTGYCYGSSQTACKFTKLYHNSICYPYALPSTNEECLHGYLLARTCYYDSRYGAQYVDRRVTCNRGDADLRSDQYCYYSSPVVCQYAKNYANGVCYPYLVKSRIEQCSDGFYKDGLCYLHQARSRAASRVVRLSFVVLLLTCLWGL